MQPAIEADKWYWAEEARLNFDMSPATIAEIKREYPESVATYRMGDTIEGKAIIEHGKKTRKQRVKQ